MTVLYAIFDLSVDQQMLSLYLMTPIKIIPISVSDIRILLHALCCKYIN